MGEVAKWQPAGLDSQKCKNQMESNRSVYSRVPLIWTPKGLAKSVHISELSTVVDTLSCGHIIVLYRKNKRAGQKVSIKEECPHRRSVHKGELYCISNLGQVYNYLQFIRPFQIKTSSKLHMKPPLTTTTFRTTSQFHIRCFIIWSHNGIANELKLLPEWTKTICEIIICTCILLITGTESGQPP